VQTTLMQTSAVATVLLITIMESLNQILIDAKEEVGPPVSVVDFKIFKLWLNLLFKIAVTISMQAATELLPRNSEQKINRNKNPLQPQKLSDKVTKAYGVCVVEDNVYFTDNVRIH
jgi:hypothetical protein